MAYKAPNPSSHSKARIQRTEAYAEKVRRIYAQTVNDILALKLRCPDLDGGVMYSFDGDTQKIQAEVERLLRRLHSSVVAAISQGIELEWGIANNECDALVRSCFGQRLIKSGHIDAWMQRNGDAMRAFIARSDNGMNLSDRVWRDSRHLRDEMEAALTVAMGEGKSAAEISRDVRKYLNDPDLMMRRFSYKEREPILDEEGNIVGYTKGEWKKKWKKRIADPDRPGRYKWIDVDRDSYIPKGAGANSRGVYKSAAKNSMRLARTETNMAYRNADHERWQQLDFVKGFRVILSKQHPQEDICDLLSAPNLAEYDKDDMRGVYPKDFRFEGWHPQCFCFATPILVSEDEMLAYRDAAMRGEDYELEQEDIVDYPKEFKDWCIDNEKRITDPRYSNPYFVDHNQVVVAKILRREKFKKELRLNGDTEALMQLLGKYRNVKAKPSTALYMDLTGGIATLLANLVNKEIANREKVGILHKITEMKSFEIVEKEGKCMIRAWNGISNSAEYIQNLITARKAMMNGYDVFMLPNPSSSKSGDFILRKDSKLYLYESKTIHGMGSVGNRLVEASRQSDRIMLNVEDTTESRLLAKELKSFFENNPQVQDVLIFKGKRELHVSRQKATSKKFVIEFMRIWDQ